MRESTTAFTLAEMDAVMREHGIGEDGYLYKNATGKVIGRDVQHATSEYREGFRDQVNHVARLLRYSDRTNALDHTVHGLKVEIEQATRKYVTNGSVLVAIILLGIPVKRIEERNSGAHVAISSNQQFPVARVA